MNTISRSPGRRARGVASEEVGLCIAATLWTGSVGLTRANPVHHAGIAIPAGRIDAFAEREVGADYRTIADGSQLFLDRKRVVEGKRVEVRVDHGGGGSIKKNKEKRKRERKDEER